MCRLGLALYLSGLFACHFNVTFWFLPMVSFTLKFASTSFSFSLMFCQSMSLSNSNRCRLFNSSYVAVSISNVPLYYFVPLILSLFFTPYSLHPYAHFNRHTLFPPPHPRSTKNNIHKQSQSEQHNMERFLLLLFPLLFGCIISYLIREKLVVRCQRFSSFISERRFCGQWEWL